MHQYLFLGIGLFLSTICLSQPLQLSTYNIDEGLSRGIIKSVITDDIGFVWSATDDGVIRFDGKNSVFFKELLPRGFAKAFCKRRNGQLLVLHDYGIAEIISQPDTAYSKDFLHGSINYSDTTIYYPKTIYEDSKGILWVGENQAVIKYADGKFQKFRFLKDRSASLWHSFAMAEDDFGTLWIISNNGNLYYFNSFKDDFIQIPLTQRISESSWFTNFGDGRFLIGAKEGLFEIKPDSSSKILQIRKIAVLNNISCGIIVNDNELYIGTFDNGLYRSKLNSSEIRFERIDLLPFADIINLFLDRNGLWICSSDAIGLLHPVFFGRFNFDEGQDHIHSINLAKDSTLVVSTSFKIHVLKKVEDQWAVDLTLPPPNSAVQALKVTNGFWLGSFDGNLFYYDLKKQTYRKIEGLTSTSITKRMLEDVNNNIWICGSTNDGLIRISKNGKLFKYQTDGLMNSTVIKEGNDGTIICAGGNSKSYLFKYQPQTDSFEDISIKLPFEINPNFVVNDVLIENGGFLLGTSQGLLRYRIADREIERIDLKKVGIEEQVIALARGKNNTLWASTSEGVIKFQNDKVLLFDYTRGLPSRTLTERGLLVDPDNTLWVGTIRGLAFLKDDSLNIQETPRPIFKSLKVNGKKVRIDSQDIPSFPFNTFIESDFISLSFPTDRIKYQTRVVEKDTVWSKPTFENVLTISSFDPGKYTFQVRAQQHGGLVWSRPLIYQFFIADPWYMGWWAISLFLLGFSGVVIGSVRIYNWNLLKKNERLEEIIEHRTKEINKQKNELIEHKTRIISQKEKLIHQNQLVFETQKSLADAELRNRKLHEKQLEQDLESRNKQLTTITLKIIQKNEALKDLKSEIVKIVNSSSQGSRPGLNRLVKRIDLNLKLEKDWNEFSLCFEHVYVGFYKNLKNSFPDLTTHDLRHSALIRLNLTIKEASDVLGVSPESVKIFRLRLRKKLQIESQKNLVEFIINV